MHSDYSQEHFATLCHNIISTLRSDLATIHVGKASSTMIDTIQVYVPSYGMSQPLNTLGNTSVLDAQTIKIESWDKKILPAMEKAIYDADLGLQPVNHGEYIMVTVPPLTGERRKEIAKHITTIGEEAKVAIRKQRQDFIKHNKNLFEAKEISEDEKFAFEENINDIVKKNNDSIDDIIAIKAKEVQVV